MAKREILSNSAIELEKIEKIITTCINCLYGEETEKESIAYILEEIKPKINSIIEDILDETHYICNEEESK